MKLMGFGVKCEMKSFEDNINGKEAIKCSCQSLTFLLIRKMLNSLEKMYSIQLLYSGLCGIFCNHSGRVKSSVLNKQSRV